jgi:hypothetical protein
MALLNIKPLAEKVIKYDGAESLGPSLPAQSTGKFGAAKHPDHDFQHNPHPK